jgi:hypothetical protein
MGRYAAATLLKRMLDAGISFYEPDPRTALEKAIVSRPQSTHWVQIMGQ